MMHPRQSGTKTLHGCNVSRFCQKFNSHGRLSFPLGPFINKKHCWKILASFKSLKKRQANKDNLMFVSHKKIRFAHTCLARVRMNRGHVTIESFSTTTTITCTRIDNPRSTGSNFEWSYIPPILVPSFDLSVCQIEFGGQFHPILNTKVLLPFKGSL